jgi:hypothetical protein
MYAMKRSQNKQSIDCRRTGDVRAAGYLSKEKDNKKIQGGCSGSKTARDEEMSGVCSDKWWGSRKGALAYPSPVGEDRGSWRALRSRLRRCEHLNLLPYSMSWYYP